MEAEEDDGRGKKRGIPSGGGDDDRLRASGEAETEGREGRKKRRKKKPRKEKGN